MRKDRSKAMGYSLDCFRTRLGLIEEIVKAVDEEDRRIAAGEKDDGGALHLQRLRQSLADWDEREQAEKKVADAKQDNIGGLVRAIIMLSYHVGDYHENGSKEQADNCLKSIRKSARSIAAVVDEPLEKEYTDLE